MVEKPKETQVSFTPGKKPSKAWYLVPIFFGIIGGVAMYLVLKDEDKKMAKNGLVLGIILGAIGVVIAATLYGALIGLMFAHNYQQHLNSNFRPAMPLADNNSITGLVADWRFENNTQDSSGQGIDGIAYGGTSFVPGKFGQALKFNGTGVDRIPYRPSMDFPTSSFSISLWVKSTASNLGLIVDHRRNNDACYSGYSIEDAGSGKLVGRARICAPATDMAANFDVLTNTVNDGKWHHIVYVVDRTNHVSKMYQDDMLVSTSDISALGNISQTSIGLDLGGTDSPNTPVDSYTGLLDQARIYGHALTVSEIQQLYNEH